MPVGASIVLVVVVGVLLASKAAGPSSEEVEAYQDYLQSQVDTETGAPRDGRDPANQQQSSLASAAANSFGAGQRVDQPAANVDGDHSHHHDSSDVYGDPSQTGIGINGCYIDYGIQGQECVPAHAATNGTLTCQGVKSHGFSNGIEVTGTDRFHLDKNGDDIACNSGD
jgi:hypothetical protein